MSIRVRRVAFFSCTSAIVATAVGAALAVFVFLNALWLRPPPVADPDRVVVVLRNDVRFDPARWGSSALDMFRANPVFEGIAGQLVPRDGGRDLAADVAVPGVRRRLETIGVTADYFSVLGVRVTGRAFVSTDNQVHAPAVAVMSDRLWRDAFGSDPAVIGAVVRASPEPLRIVGVAHAGFGGAFRGENVDLWLPEAILPRLASGVATGTGPTPLVAIGRLRPTVPLDQATHAFRVGHASTGRETSNLTLAPLGSLFQAPDLPLVAIDDSGVLALVWGIAALVLVAACATLLALLLMHYDRRRREFVTRLTLGETPTGLGWRMCRQLLAIGVAGTVGAVVVGRAIVAVLPHFSLPGGVDLSRLGLTLDWRVMAAAACASALVVGTAGTSAAVHVLHSVTLRGRNDGTRRSLRFRQYVLAGHVTVTIALLSAAALVVATARNAAESGPGFDEQHTLFVSVQTRSFRGWTDERIASQVERDVSASRMLLNNLRDVPGVTAAGFGPAPLGRTAGRGLEFESVIVTEAGDLSVNVSPQLVSPDYLTAIGARFDEGSAGRTDDVVITRTLAEALWPGQTPIGRWLRWNDISGRVSGTVDTAMGSIRFGRPFVLFALKGDDNLHNTLRRSSLEIAVASPRVDLVRETVRRMVNDTFRDALRVNLESGADLVGKDLGPERLASWFLAGVGTIAWMLGMCSVFGLVSYVAHTREREFGVMMALGADRAVVTRSAMGMGLTPVLLGTGAAGLLSVLLEPAIRSRIIDLSTGGTWELHVVPALTFGSCAAGAALCGAWRLQRLDPASLLRRDS